MNVCLILQRSMRSEFGQNFRQPKLRKEFNSCQRFILLLEHYKKSGNNQIRKNRICVNLDIDKVTDNINNITN